MFNVLGKTLGEVYMVECDKGRFIVDIEGWEAHQFTQSVQTVLARGYWMDPPENPPVDLLNEIINAR